MSQLCFRILSGYFNNFIFIGERKVRVLDIRCPPEDLAFDIARSRGGGDFRAVPYRMGAVLVDRSGRIFSWGWCHLGESRLGGRSVHAEEHAISRANKKRLRGATLYVAGLRRSTSNLPERVILAKPCSLKCERLAAGYGIGKIKYSTPEGWDEMSLGYN